MNTHATTWICRQKAATALKPEAKVKNMQVRRGGGQTRVVIEGNQLFCSLSPARITVDGVELTKPTFDARGRRITGVLPVLVPGRHVVVNYGFHRMEWQRRRWRGDLIYLGEEILRLARNIFSRRYSF